MRVVIYDAEGYEPLTVIDIPQHFMREIENGDRPPALDFPVALPITFKQVSSEAERLVTYSRVRLNFEPIYKSRAREPYMWVCSTHDGETALLLRSTFLPGQRGELNRQTENAFIEGLLAAVKG